MLDTRAPTDSLPDDAELLSRSARKSGATLYAANT